MPERGFLQHRDTYMRFSPSEHETLIGPAVVGVIVGTVLAACSVAFDSEYGGRTPHYLSPISSAMLAFFAGFFLAFVPFGVAPLLIGRLRSSSSNGDS